MKPKFIVCLAFVLCGGLFGCSTTLSKHAGEEIFNNREAVCLNSDDSARPWQLEYALTERTWNEGKLFLTVHERISSLRHPDYDPESSAAIYVKIGNKLKLLKRITTDGLSCYLKPNVIWFAPNGQDKEQLIQITELFYGSGALTQEHIFTTSSGKEFAQDLKLEEVEFIPAWESYKFGKDECIWKDESSTLTDDGLFFEFIIWKYENRTNHPVGKVTGTYKLEREADGKLRIIVDKFKREPITDSDSHK